jgi:hypothetical protein
MGAWVEIKDTGTGETRRYRDESFEPDDASEFMWTEGNYSCDCNRSLFFAWAANEADPEPADCGGTRYLAIRAICDTGAIVELDDDTYPNSAS